MKLERGHVRHRGRGPRRLALVGAALGDPLRGVGLEVGDPLGRSSLLGAELRGRPLLRLDQLALLMGTAFCVDLLAQRGRRQVAQDVGSDLPSLFATRSKFRIDRTHRSRGPGIIRPLLRDVRWSGNWEVCLVQRWASCPPRTKGKMPSGRAVDRWWGGWGSNPRPRDYRSLTATPSTAVAEARCRDCIRTVRRTSLLGPAHLSHRH